MTLLRHITGRTLWLVLGALAVAAWVAHGTGASEPDPAQAWMATKDQFHSRVRVLWGEVALHLHHEARLTQDTAQLRRSLHAAQGQIEDLVLATDSLHRAPLTAAVRRIGEACGELTQNCEARVEAAHHAFDAEHATVVLLSGRLTGADTVIANLRRATQCSFLFLTCPSRTRVAEGAFVAGILLTLLVHH